eukprot:11202656-Lingulodinium_polyedra.AAC.1
MNTDLQIQMGNRRPSLRSKLRRHMEANGGQQLKNLNGPNTDENDINFTIAPAWPDNPSG